MIAAQHHALPISRDTIYMLVITVAYVISGMWNVLGTQRRTRRMVMKIHADWDARELLNIATRDAGLLKMKTHYDESIAEMRRIYAGSVATMERTSKGYELVMGRVVRDLGVGELRSAEDYVRELREFVAIVPPPERTN